MTVEKIREIFLEDEQKLKINSGVLVSMICSHGYKSKKVGICQYCGKTGHKKNLCWKKYLKLISNQYKSEEKKPPMTYPKKTLFIGKNIFV